MEFNRSYLIVRLKSIDFGNRLKCRNECDLVLPVSRVCTESWILEIKKSCNFPDLEIVWKVGITKVLSFFFSKLQQVLLKWNLGRTFAEHFEKSFVLAFFKVCMRRCLHEKTRTGASFIPGWLFDFVSRYMVTRSFHISLFEGTLHVDKINVWF